MCACVCARVCLPVCAWEGGLQVRDNLSVGDLKYEIEDRLFITPVAQRLFFKGMRMQDGQVTSTTCSAGL